MPPKIVIIGGGSYNWAPTIINDILLTPGLRGSRIVLEDISPEPLKTIRALGEKMIADKKSDCTLTSTTDEAEALEGADFVIVTISTGGFATMENDLAIPLKYGVTQTVGDSVGPGGMARALRTIPVMVGIARKMEKLCPDAWYVNITNPMSAICLALNQAAKVKNIGLCHELRAVLYILRDMLKLPKDVPTELTVAGVNHFIWFLSLSFEGRDAFEMLREWMKNPTEFHVDDEDAKLMFAPSLIDTAKLKLELFERYGYLPAAGDRHIAEFFDGYLKDPKRAEEKYGVKLTTIQERRDSWFAAMKAYAEGMLEGTFPLPAGKSNEAISDVIASLAGEGSMLVDIVNLPNKGHVTNLPDGAIVETLARFSADRASPLDPLELPEGIRKLVNPHAENQFLLVKAALEGDRASARKFLSRDPLTRNCTDIDKMLDELLTVHVEYLPRFK